MTTFPTLVNIGVTPAVNPTVAKAENTSKTKSIKFYFSLIAKTNKPVTQIKKLTIAIVKARLTT